MPRTGRRCIGARGRAGRSCIRTTHAIRARRRQRRRSSRRSPCLRRPFKAKGRKQDGSIASYYLAIILPRNAALDIHLPGMQAAHGAYACQVRVSQPFQFLVGRGLTRRCRHAPAAPRSVDRRSHACKAGRRSHGAPGAVRLAGGRSMSGACKPAGQNDAKPILQLRIMLRSSKRSARSGKHGKQPKRILITSEQFRDARISSHLSREEAARFLGVSLRTIGHWETGKSRPNYAAFKLLRIFRNGDLIDPEWSGYSIIRGKLVTPENHEFAPGDLSWLSLLCRRAQAVSGLRQ